MTADGFTIKHLGDCETNGRWSLVRRGLGVEVDGAFGPVTAAAVGAWKRARGNRTPSRELTPAERVRLLADVLLRAVRTMERWAAKGLHEDPPRSDRVPELITLAGRLGV